jgi:putative hydrolase
MIRIIGDYHTHTTHSHGTGTIEDNVRAAVQAGLSVIAISDHGTGHLFYPIRSIDRYLREIGKVREKYAGQIRVLASIEANLISLDGRLDISSGDYEDAFDMILFGYHKMAAFPGLKNKLHFFLPKSKSVRAVKKNTQAYIAAMYRNRVHVISHPGYGIPIDKLALAAAAKECGVALEINAKHPEFSSEELRACAQTGVQFIIGSDAHSPQHVGNFIAAIQRAEEAGLSPAQIINSDAYGDLSTRPKLFSK